jgi:hypothetical protein
MERRYVAILVSSYTPPTLWNTNDCGVTTIKCNFPAAKKNQRGTIVLCLHEMQQEHRQDDL